MDISDINKVANRKRLNANAEKLREKISRENRNIIKLKVAQDTAYWDLKEQLRQVENNHERLQQNMVDVQMQHEAISGQYQDELRLRPETLNKLSGTREICDVLEDYSERLRDTLSRCKADQAALYEAYQKSGQVVRDIKTQQLQAGEKNQLTIESLQDKLKVTSEHHAQLLQYFSAEKQKCDAALVEVKSKLAAATARRDELVAAGNDLARKLDQQAHELGKKEETILNLQRDIKQLIQEFNAQGTEMRNTILKQEKELKETSGANDSLKQALTNQEIFTKSVCDQNNQLQDKIAALDEEKQAAGNVVKELEVKLEGMTLANRNLETELATATEFRELLEKNINEKCQLLANAEAEIVSLKSQLSELETKKCEVTCELGKAGDETKAMAAKVQEMTATAQALETKVEELEAMLKDCKEKADNTIQELTTTIATKDKELDTKASTISHLMSEVKNGMDACDKIELAMQRVKRETEIELEAARDKERKFVKQVEQLEAAVRNKDDELSNQMNIILELRSDKERLHEKIQGMQNKIDNIQKELTGAEPGARRERHEPEHDDNDNAVMLTPAHKKTTPPISQRGDFVIPRSEPKQIDSMVLNFLSDSSVDGDNTLDATEVSRRFEALSRGERVSPTPLVALKRRHRAAVPLAQGGLRLKHDHNIISLSQVKDDMMKNKERSFFKNKRHDSKPKKVKQSAPY